MIMRESADSGRSVSSESGRGHLQAVQRALTRVMTALVIAGAAALGAAGPAAATAGYHTRHWAVPGVDARIAAYALTFIGRYPYQWGGSSPATGFDCSGLTSYIYRHYGLAIPRTAEGQFAAFRRVSRAAAMPGDLVFFHGAFGYVYHVGVYEGRGNLVAAADPDDGIVLETIWSPAVTFGTLTRPAGR